MSAVRGVPRVQVRLDGAPLTGDDLDALTSVRVQQQLSVPTLCEVSFLGAASLARRGVEVGASLEVLAGDEVQPLFSGEVTAVEYAHGPDRTCGVRIRAYDPLHRLRKRQPVRAHVEVTAEELAAELASSVGLTVRCAASLPLWRHLVQHRQSDLDFLAELAGRAGLYLTVRGQVLHLASLEGIDDVPALLLGEGLLEAQLEVNAETACRSVTAAGWNVREADALRAEAGRARSGRSVSARVAADAVGGSGERLLVDERAEIEAHVEGVAQAELDRRVAREVVFRGVAEGSASLRPLARVELKGVAESVAGVYVLTEVTHTVDAERGYLCELSSEPPPVRRKPTAAAVALGVVTRVDGGSGRVKVKLPAQADVETDWLQVASVGAGEGKGLTVVPDVDDHVLVVFAHEDPAQGVVLGGLYGKDGPSDSGIEDGGVRRFTLKSRGGHILRFDDGKKLMRFEDPGGSFLELGPEGVTLGSKVPLTIEAKGQPVVIRGDTIDFKRG